MSTPPAARCEPLLGRNVVRLRSQARGTRLSAPTTLWRMRGRRAGVVAVALSLVALAVLAGCSGGGSDERGGTSRSYVALGDSFASGPALGDPDVKQPGCLRSLSNYPRLVAAARGDRLVDVTCGGESTDTMVNGRTLEDGTVVRPQLTSLTRKTSLVTITIGANDGGATNGLFSYCLLPQTATDAACSTFTATYMPTVFPTMQTNVVATLERVRERAPAAKIVLVGYERYAPDDTGCTALPLSAANLAAVRAFEKQRNDVLVAAARTAKVPYVDMYTASKGHDACAGASAWVNGVENSPTGDGSFLHPTGAGMRAAAAAVSAKLGD